MNITLIGMPGAGKSTVGVIAAKMANLDFIDTDLLIQQRENQFLWEIIDKKGIEYFKNLEAVVITSTTFANSLIATGGSAVYSQHLMNYLKSKSTVVFLNVPLEELDKRVKNFIKRGIVANKGATLLDVYKERQPLYEKYADITIDCISKSMEEIAQEVAQIKEN